VTPIRPRRAVHRGSVLASGLAVDTRLVPEAEARARILRLSVHNATAYRVGPFVIARFAEPARLDCAASGGAPLVRYGRLLSSAPLEPDEQAALDTPIESAVIVAAGLASAAPLDDAAREDMALWLDVSSFELVKHVRPLGGVAAEPEALIAVGDADVRAPLGLPPLNEEAAEIARALAQRGGAGGGGGGAPAGSFLWRLFSGIAGAFKAAARALAPSREMTPGGSRALAVVPSAERKGATWLTRLRGALQHLAARALLASRLAHLVGRRHAEYLARMLEMFDENDLDKALRHAIPLREGAGEEQTSFPLLPPAARTDLTIAAARAAGGSALELGGGLFEELRKRYRRAFDRLLSLGEIEKAAFVLAELLGANEEAVSFLERYGLLKLAAEIAEARGLSPGIIVRQWFLAGDKARAVQIARRTGAFADAISRLEQERDSAHKNAARALRLLWADALASAGAYAAAIDAIWPIEEARRLGLAWIDLAIAVGGPTGARMLARKARLLPEAFAEIGQEARRLLRENDEAEDSERIAQAFGQELLAGELTAEARALAKEAVRALLRGEKDKDVDRLIERLIDASGDAALRVDVRALGSKTAKPQPKRRVHVRAFGRTDAGKSRAYNEDLCLVGLLGGLMAPMSTTRAEGDAGELGLLLAVFDGMGGHSAGDVATQIAAQTIFLWLRDKRPQHEADPKQWARCLAVSIEQANLAIYRDSSENPKHRGMGSTATVATLSGGDLLIGQVGDSRAYVLRRGELVQVTRDHSLINEYISIKSAEGNPMTEEEIREFPHKNIITRALGVAERLDVTLTRVGLQDGDVLLLCSDGLSGVVNEEEIQMALASHEAPEAACDALIAAALDAGGPDNIAVVVARFEGSGIPSVKDVPVVYEPFTPPTLVGEEQKATRLLSRSESLSIRRPSGDRGAIAVLDAAELPDGRMLVALGEIGVWLLSREGKVLTRFAEPASAIVLSDHGDRAMLLAPRGEAYRVARLDLAMRRVRPFCDARFEQFAPSFDGSIWFVARGGALYAIDAASDRWEHLWSVEERGALMSAVQRNTKELTALLARRGAGLEVWSFELPSLTLRSRRTIDDPFWACAVSPGGNFAGWQVGASGEAIARSEVYGSWKDIPIAASPSPLAPYVTEEWIALPVKDASGTTLYLFEAPGLKLAAQISLEGAESCGAVRFQGDRLVVSDSHGRVLVLSLKTGAVLREHRVS
jgi:serine/threonine protein phosphatase PrpC